jgi:hypothetical protein
MKVRKPRFLTPRRRYEVNESMQLVQFGRAKLSATLRFLEKVVLFIEWGRVPRQWEVSFVAKMKSMEAKGISFPDVLRTYLPTVYGDAPSEVLFNWVGRKARHQPKAFVQAVSKMFGPSAKSIVGKLENVADPEAMLEARRPAELPFQSLVDAINQHEALLRD